MRVLASLNKAAAVARSVRRASAFVATVGNAMRQVALLQRTLGPGSFLSDLVLIANRRTGDERRMAAAQRLASLYVTRRAIFHPNRWSFLRDEFDVRRNGRGFVVAWVELAAPAILLAFEAIPGDTPLPDVWPELRRRVREEIERDLVGQTLDRKIEGRIAGDLDPATPPELMRAEDLKLDDLAALKRLGPAERDLLMEYYSVGSAGRNALAKSLGISGARLRKRIQRARDRSRKFSA